MSGFDCGLDFDWIVQIVNLISGFDFGLDSDWIVQILDLISGFDFGFYMEIPLNDKIYLNPELLYSQKTVSFTYPYIFDYPINRRDEYATSNKIKQGLLQLNPILDYQISNLTNLLFQNLLLVFQNR